MDNGWSPENVSLDTTSSKVIAGVVSNEVVSKEYAVTASGSLYHVVRIVVSDVAVTGSITAKLQTAIGSTWEDAKTVSVTTDDAYYIRLLPQVAGDQTYLPLLAKCRVVVTTTDAADEVTVDSVDVLQGL